MFRFVTVEEFITLVNQGRVTKESRWAHPAHKNNGWTGEGSILFAWTNPENYPVHHFYSRLRINFKESLVLLDEGIAEYHWKDRFGDEQGVSEYPEAYISAYGWDDIESIEVDKSDLMGPSALLEQFIYPAKWLGGRLTIFPRQSWENNWRGEPEMYFPQEDYIKVFEYLCAMQSQNIEIVEILPDSKSDYPYSKNRYHIITGVSRQELGKIQKRIGFGNRVIAACGDELIYFECGMFSDDLHTILQHRDWPRSQFGIQDAMNYWKFALNLELGNPDELLDAMIRSQKLQEVK